MEMSIGGGVVSLDRRVFEILLENSVAGTYVGYERALATGTITFRDLTYLASRGEIPIPLFFAPLRVAESQVKSKMERLLAGISRETFSIGSRAKVELRDVELIVKDLIRKQELLRTHDDSLTRNKIIGLLRKCSGSAEMDASTLMGAMGLTVDDITNSRRKEDALELVIDRLERNQILVSRSVQNYMPQRLTHVKFSGMTIKDSKVPFIFLAGGDHGDGQEPAGRTLFTLILMTVLVARRIFAPLTWDGGSTEVNLHQEYDVAGAMLMPASLLGTTALASLDDIKGASDRFKVTPSAVTVRAMRLGLLPRDKAHSYLRALRREFDQAPKDGPRSAILPENAVRKYGGRELSRRMLRALDESRIIPGEFCRTVCLKHLKPHQIDDLRRVVG